MTRRYSRLMRREPLGVTQRTNRAVMLAQISDPAQRARFEADFPESNMKALPKKRGPRAPQPQFPGVDIDAVHRKFQSEDVEAPVLKAVGELLAVHPRVLFAVRQNTGAMHYERDGRPVPIWFYRIVRKPEDMTIVDFWGLLRDGKPFAFECKKPSWTKPTKDHELKQAAFLRMIECIGGVSRFVTDVRQADEALIPHTTSGKS